MTQPASSSIDAPDGRGALWPARERVRTPGKHLVLFFVAAILMLTLSTSVLDRRADNADRVVYTRAGDLYYAPFDPIITDLATDRDGRDRFVSLTPIIVLDGEAARAEFEVHEAQIRERMTMLLRALTARDFDDDTGMARVRDELRARVNLLLDTNGAHEVIVDELIIQ